MCYSAESSLGGFVTTWALGLALISWTSGKLGHSYNVWTGALMMVVSLIQLLEFYAWTHFDDDRTRTSVARLVKPTLLLQPAANFALAAFALQQPLLLYVALAYFVWALHALANPPCHADIHRGKKGHLAWYGDARHQTAMLNDKEGFMYMLGLFVPLALPVFLGNVTYGIVALTTMAATFSFSVLRYPSAEASSLWCFWGLLYTIVGASLNFT